MCSDEVNRKRRRLIATTGVVGGAGVVAGAVPFLSSWQPSARARAIGAPVEVDIGDMQPGDRKTVQWQGKPVWILRRSDDMLDELSGLENALRDPHSEVADQQPQYAQNEYRAREPEYLVVIGLCTHLGCSPTYLEPGEENDISGEWHGGFFCPCHGSRFDLAGRVYKGVPAPTNMVVPPYKFLSDTRLLIGDDSAGGAA